MPWIADVERKYTAVFYSMFFVLSYEFMTMFDEAREVGNAILHALPLHQCRAPCRRRLAGSLQATVRLRPVSRNHAAEDQARCYALWKYEVALENLPSVSIVCLLLFEHTQRLEPVDDIGDCIFEFVVDRHEYPFCLIDAPSFWRSLAAFVTRLVWCRLRFPTRLLSSQCFIVPPKYSLKKFERTFPFTAWQSGGGYQAKLSCRACCADENHSYLMRTAIHPWRERDGRTDLARVFDCSERDSAAPTLNTYSPNRRKNRACDLLNLYRSMTMLVANFRTFL
jgi:hypothetical protein